MIGWLQRFFDSTRSDFGQKTGVDFGALARVIGCEISNESLFEQALRHRSLLRGKHDARSVSNERLEYLGDAILGFVVAERLYSQYPDEDEGFLTRLRAKLVNGRALAQRARELQLGNFILVSDSLTDEQRNSDSILADAFEAIIGAIYLEHGVEASRVYIQKTVLHEVDLDQLADRKDNHKSILLEYVQERTQNQPQYVVISERGPSHDRRFVIAVNVEGEEYGRAEDRSKKRAEQAAAKEAIARLRSRDSDE